MDGLQVLIKDIFIMYRLIISYTFYAVIIVEETFFFIIINIYL